MSAYRQNNECLRSNTKLIFISLCFTYNNNIEYKNLLKLFKYLIVTEYYIAILSIE